LTSQFALDSEANIGVLIKALKDTAITITKRDMAELHTIKTGDQVETRLRGRVFRYAPQLPKGQRPKSKERRRVCVLDAAGARDLSVYGQGQPCHGPRCRHTHQTREVVEKLVRDGIMRWMGQGRNVAGYSYGRTWKGVGSGPQRVKVMQLVSGA
jgi:hypothetical protein